MDTVEIIGINRWGKSVKIDISAGAPSLFMNKKDAKYIYIGQHVEVHQDKAILKVVMQEPYNTFSFDLTDCEGVPLQPKTKIISYYIDGNEVDGERQVCQRIFRVLDAARGYNDKLTPEQREAYIATLRDTYNVYDPIRFMRVIGTYHDYALAFWYTSKEFIIARDADWVKFLGSIGSMAVKDGLVKDAKIKHIAECPSQNVLRLSYSKHESDILLHSVYVRITENSRKISVRDIINVQPATVVVSGKSLRGMMFSRTDENGKYLDILEPCAPAALPRTSGIVLSGSIYNGKYLICCDIEPTGYTAEIRIDPKRSGKPLPGDRISWDDHYIYGPRAGVVFYRVGIDGKKLAGSLQ